VEGCCEFGDETSSSIKSGKLSSGLWMSGLVHRLVYLAS
jgi:hypothetical protein